MDERRKELLAVCSGKEAETGPLVEEILFLENQLREIKKLPFYKTNPKNRNQIKPLPAARLYRELLQQYNTSLKTLARLTGHDSGNGDSPLRKWVKDHAD